MKNAFRIRHGQPDFDPIFGVVPAGPIQVFAVGSGSDSRVFRDIPARRSRAGVKYGPVFGTTIRKIKHPRQP